MGIPGKDKFGRTVKIGDRVRLLSIKPSLIKRLTGDEQSDVSSLIGAVVDVFDVYDDGSVWISSKWTRGNGITEVHAIAVQASDIELIA